MKQPKLETLYIMPIDTHALVKKLQKKQAFTEPQAEVLVETIADITEKQLVTKIQLDTQIKSVRADIKDFRQENTAEFKNVRAEIKDLRQEMTDGFKSIRQEMTDEFKSVRQEMTDEFKSVRQEMTDEFKSVRQEITSQGIDLSNKIETQGIEIRAEIASLRFAMEKMGSDFTIRTAIIITTIAAILEFIHRVFK